ncbi:rhodanese-like domain-containing protein [Pseudodesulfovibrio sp. S3]|nr:rhodanese-like domain-containing protein [Pseudodesulfovibrio sp. S3-i]RWU03153.1 rhodanese-like domain-containing protein [Pseudodesulfovibrio sp. S3]
MPRTYSYVACLLLALCFVGFRPAWADENEAWWSSAKAEAEREGYALLDDAGLKALIESGGDMVLLDARADYEFAAGHIPKAVNLEFDLGDNMDLPQAKGQALEALTGDKKRALVIYCRSFR